jgi:hypothetical protein
MTPKMDCDIQLLAQIGLLCLFLSFILTSRLTPTLSEPAPAFFYIFVAIMQFAYQVHSIHPFTTLSSLHSYRSLITISLYWCNE